MGLKQAIHDFYYGTTLNELQRMNKSRVFPNISYNSLLYLDLIDMTPNCTVSRLAEILHVSKSAVTIKVGELLKQGLVEKRQSEVDRRVSYLTVNNVVVEEYRAYDTSLRRAVKAVEQQFSTGEIDNFVRVLAAFRAAYSEVIAEEEPQPVSHQIIEVENA